MGTNGRGTWGHREKSIRVSKQRVIDHLDQSKFSGVARAKIRWGGSRSE